MSAVLPNACFSVWKLLLRDEWLHWRYQVRVQSKEERKNPINKLSQQHYPACIGCGTRGSEPLRPFFRRRKMTPATFYSQRYVSSASSSHQNKVWTPLLVSLVSLSSLFCYFHDCCPLCDFRCEQVRQMCFKTINSD